MSDKSKSNDNSANSIYRVLYNLECEPPEKLIVTLNMPEQDKSCDWLCKVFIRGKKQWSHSVYGIDAFQSLFLGLEAIRKYLEENYKNLQWEGGANGEHGFSLIVPHFLNLSIVSDIEKMINVELEKTETWK